MTGFSCGSLLPSGCLVGSFGIFFRSIFKKELQQYSQSSQTLTNQSFINQIYSFFSRMITLSAGIFSPLKISLCDLKCSNCQLQLRKMNELSAGERIMMPKTVLRTISLEKLRNPTPPNQRLQNPATKQSQPKGIPEGQAQTNKYEKILDRKLGISKQDQENASRVGNHDGRKMSKKMQDIKKEMEENEMKECTFKPAVKAVEKPRTVSNFFQDQLAFCQKKNDKIQEMRAILEANKVKDNIFRPNAMLHRHHKPQDVEKVHERLYQDSKNKDKQSEISQNEAQTIKTNSITKSQRFKGLSRGTSAEKIAKTEVGKHSQAPSQQFYKFSLHTHNDASSVDLSSITTRKQSVQLHAPRQASKECKAKQPCKRVDLNIFEKKDNGKNEQLCIQKLMRQMVAVMDRCGLPLVFNYLQMNLFFQKMNFMPKEASDNARKALFQIWNMLQGEIFKEVSALSVMKVVYAILGCHNVDFVSKCISDTWLSAGKAEMFEQRLKEEGRQLTLKQNLLIISERDSKTIKTNFEELYLNRLKLGESELVHEDRPNEYAFKPVISRASNELAEKYRNRVLQESEKLISQNRLQFQVPEDGQIDHVRLLMLDEKRKDAVMQQKREERERERRRLEEESMISLNQTDRSNRSTLHIQKDRNQQLYEMGKVYHQSKKDKSADQVAEERWRNELTFKPNLKTRTNILSALNSKENFIPDYDKAVYRMHEGRKLREGQSSERNEGKDTSPLLYLNVVMEGCQSAKVAVYAQDNMRSITEKVRSILELDPQGNSQKLEKILKMQILPALKQMGIKLE